MLNRLIARLDLLKDKDLGVYLFDKELRKQVDQK